MAIDDDYSDEGNDPVDIPPVGSHYGPTTDEPPGATDEEALTDPWKGSAQRQGPVQGPQQPNWSAIALAEPTWNQADEIDLQRLTNGASYLRNQSMAGTHGPETTSALTAQLNEQLGPLMLRKQQAEKFAEGQATQQALHGNAMAGGIRAIDMKNNAVSFPDQVHERYNPNTGGIDLFFQHKPGEWTLHPGEVSEATESEADSSGMGSVEGEGGSGEGAPLPPMAPDGKAYGDTPRYREVTGPDGVLRQQRIPSRAEFEAMQSASPQDQVRIAGQIANGTFGQPQGDGGPMSITQGLFTDNYEGGRLASSNRPVEPPATAGMTNDHKQAMAEIGNPPNQFFRGAHGQMLPNPQYGQWQREIATRAAAIGKERRQLQAETARADLADKKAKADLTEKQRADLYGKEVDRIKKEIHDHRLHTKKPSDVPDELKGPSGQYLTPSEQHDLAHKNVDDMLRKSKGGQQDPGAGDNGGGNAPQSAPQPTGPEPGPALVEQQHGKLDVLQETLSTIPAGQDRDAAIAAVNELRPLIAQYGGDLTKAPASVQQQARQLGETIKKARPGPTKEQRSKQYLDQVRQGFGM